MTATEPDTRPVIRLSEHDTNVWFLVGRCAAALGRTGQHEESRRLIAAVLDALDAHSDDEARAAMRRYVRLEEPDAAPW